MGALPSGDLSLSTLAGLIELGEAAASRRPAPVTHPGCGVIFSAPGVTSDKAAGSAAYASPVTHAHPLRTHSDGSDEWAERAAILEYEGGWPRPMAEAIASRLLDLSQRDSTGEAMRAFDRELIELERRRRRRT